MVLVAFLVGDGLDVLVVQAADAQALRPAWLPGRFLAGSEQLDEVATQLAGDLVPDAALAWLEQVGTVAMSTNGGADAQVTVIYSTAASALASARDKPAASGARRARLGEQLEASVPKGDVEAVRLAHARLQSKLEREPIALGFMPRWFTLARLRHVYEVVWDTSLDLSNFRRKVLSTKGFVTATPSRIVLTGADGGRPALWYRSGGGGELRPPLYRPDGTRT